MTAVGDYCDASVEAVSYWDNRQERKQSSTDIGHFFAFCMFLLLWIAIACHAFIYGTPLPPFWTTQEYQQGWNFFTEKLSQYGGACFGFIWLGICFLALYFTALRWLTKIMIYLTNILTIALIGVLLGLVIAYGILPALFVPLLVIIFIYTIASLYLLKEIGSEVVCKVIQDSCKIMVHFPSSFVIVISQVILINLVATFSALIGYYLLTSEQLQCRSYEIGEFGDIIWRSYDSDSLQYILDVDPFQYRSRDITQHRYTSCERPIYLYFLLAMFICITVWIIVLIVLFGRMILHGMFTTWHQSPNKSLISSTISLRYFYITCRYHMGTLTFGSTIFTLIQTIRAVLNTGRVYLVVIRKRPILLFCIWVFLEHGTTHALVTCIAHGSGFYRSTKEAFKLVMRTPMEFAVARTITNWMLFYGLILIPILTIVPTAAFVLAQYSNNINMSAEVKFSSAVIFPVVKFVIVLITVITLFIFNTAVEATLFCFSKKANSDKISKINVPFIIDQQT